MKHHFQGEPSARKEILLNIDMKPEKESDDLSAITFYDGIALRAGDMKLLMNVPNASWHKPPELGANTDMEQDEVEYSTCHLALPLQDDFVSHAMSSLQRFHASILRRKKIALL